MKTEPVMSVEYLKSLVAAVAAILVSFHVWTPTADQMTAVLTAVAVLFPIIQFMFVRSRVTPLGAAVPNLS